MAHSSRGRGQGIASRIKADTEKKTTRVVKHIDDLSGYLHSLNTSNIHVHGNEFADMVLNFATDDSKLEEIINLIFDTTVADRAHSALGADICRLILQRDDPQRQTFRVKLMGRFQYETKQINEIRRVSIEQWLGVFAFLCEVYHKVKVAGTPIKVIGTAIMKFTLQMLSGKDTIDDEIDCICAKLKVCGKLLESESPDKMDNIIKELRRQVICKNSSSVRRCYILEVIEFRLMGWSDPTKLLDKFYPDAIADAMAEYETGN